MGRGAVPRTSQHLGRQGAHPSLLDAGAPRHPGAGWPGGAGHHQPDTRAQDGRLRAGRSGRRRGIAPGRAQADRGCFHRWPAPGDCHDHLTGQHHRSAANSHWPGLATVFHRGRGCFHRAYQEAPSTGLSADPESARTARTGLPCAGRLGQRAAGRAGGVSGDDHHAERIYRASRLQRRAAGAAVAALCQCGPPAPWHREGPDPRQRRRPTQCGS